MLALPAPGALAQAAAPAVGQPSAPATPSRSITVLGFELIEDHPDPSRAEGLKRRLAAIERQLRDGLVEQGLYRVEDSDAGRAEIDRQRARHAFLYSCEGCSQAIGQAAGTDLVLAGWVQKVSELILNVNVEVRDSATGRVALVKSVDMRGDNDESWRRAMRFMLRDWAERRRRDPSYGL